MSLHTFVVVGAGALQETANDVLLGYDRSILLEPHPALAQRLAFDYREHPSVSVVSRALVTEVLPGREFNLYRPASRSSFSEPMDLKEMYPSLNLQKVIKVDQVSVPELIQDLKNQHVTIRFDCCGFEQVLAKAFIENLDTTLLKMEFVDLTEYRPFRDSAVLDEIESLLREVCMTPKSGKLENGRSVTSFTFSKVHQELHDTKALLAESNLQLELCETKLSKAVNSQNELTKNFSSKLNDANKQKLLLDELNEASEELKRKKAEVESLSIHKHEQGLKLKALREENQRLRNRQQLFQQEFAKAENQLKLIKEFIEE